MATSTIDTDTELSAVNSILGSIGQAPVTELIFENPEISFIYNILSEVNRDVQNEGWHFNTEYHMKVSPEAVNGYLELPLHTLRYDQNDGLNDKTMDLVVRDGRLYDLVDHSDVFTEDVYLDIVRLYAFEDIPSVFQRYIIYRSSVRASTQLVSNPQLVALLQQQEAQARAICMEYECDQADPSFFGIPHENSYKSYQPYKSLLR